MICGGAEEIHYISTGVFDVLQATSIKHNDTPTTKRRGRSTQIATAWSPARVPGPWCSRTGNPPRNAVRPSMEKSSASAPPATGRTSLRLPPKAWSRPSGSPFKTPSWAPASSTTSTRTRPRHAWVTEPRASPRTAWWVTPSRSAAPSPSPDTRSAHAAPSKAAFCLAMMAGGFLAPTRNLETPDPECAPLNHIQGDARTMNPSVVMTNNFAFGGINTSLILRGA